MATIRADARSFSQALAVDTFHESSVRSAPHDAAARALRFTSATLCVTLLLQRFGLSLGFKPFSIVGPIGLSLAAFALAQGTLVFHRFRLGAFLVLSIGVVAGLTWEGISPGGGQGGEPNLQSMMQFLLLTSFAVLTFAEPVDEMRFFKKVNFWFGFVAAAGILQFVAQFAGVRIFAFTGLVPGVLLYEFGYNVQIPVGIGELFKSNGFFLIEPSTFSQVMALALIIEMLAFRRAKYLALFAGGLLLSFSGTGWIVLASFVVTAVIGMGWRGIAIGTATMLFLGALLGVGYLLVPSAAHNLERRVDEISRPGTSGHRRFVTPFWVLDDALTARPSAAIIGLGSGVSERLNTSYEYDVNTPVKVALDYGFPALLAYVLLFVAGRKSRVQAAITVPACVMFFVTGAYQQFPPVIFLVLLLISVARLRNAGGGELAVP